MTNPNSAEDVPEITCPFSCHYFSLSFEHGSTPAAFFLINERLRPAPIIFLEHPLSEHQLARLRAAGIANAHLLQELAHFHNFFLSTYTRPISRDDRKMLFRSAFALMSSGEIAEIANYVQRRDGLHSQRLIFNDPPQPSHPELPF